MRTIGKRLIGWGQRSHGIEGGIYWTRQSPKVGGLLRQEATGPRSPDLSNRTENQLQASRQMLAASGGR